MFFMPRTPIGAFNKRIFISIKTTLIFACFILSTLVSCGMDNDSITPRQTDYSKRVNSIHNLIGTRIAERIVDSLNGITHNLVDSIRLEMRKLHDKDSTSILETALNNGMNDSLLLTGVNNLLTSTTGARTGTINAYFIDLTTQTPLDSVKINVYTHDSLLGTFYSTHSGYGKVSNLKPGIYSLKFSKNNYNSFTDNWIKVIDGKITSLKVPLVKSPGLFLMQFSVYTWIMISAIALLLFILIYYAICKLGKHT